MALLSDITTPRRGSKRRLISIDGEPWRDVAADVVKRLELETGADVDHAELAARIEREEYPSARERAIKLLTYRERSTFELSARLVEDGYTESVAGSVVADLERIGLVDDERFAGMLARNLTHVRGLGRGRAARELAKAGVAPETASAALEEALPPDEELEAALRLARTAASKPGATVDKIAGRLLRRGYRPAVALTAARTEYRNAVEQASDDHLDPSDHDHLDDGDFTP